MNSLLKKTSRALLIALLPTSSLFSQTLLDLDFEGDTPGVTSRGTGTSTVSPATFVDLSAPYAPLGTVAVGSVGRNVISSSDNPLGTGQALRVYDNSGPSSAIVSQSSVFTMSLSATATQISIGFLYRGGPSLAPNSSESALRLTWGGSALNPSSSTASSTGNFGRVMFTSQNSTAGFRSSNTPLTTITDASQTNPDENANNLVQLFINRESTSMSYSDPLSLTSIVAPNSFHVWLNGVQLTSGAALAGGNFSMHNSTTPVSTIGFGTNSSQVGADWVLDNIEVVAIPEPSAVLLLGAGFSVVLFGRRLLRNFVP